MLLDAYNSEGNEDEDEDWEYVFDYSAVDEIPQSQAGFKRGHWYTPPGWKRVYKKHKTEDISTAKKQLSFDN